MHRRGIYEYNLVDDNLYEVMAPLKGACNKYFFEALGYILEIDFEEKKECDCLNMMLEMKIEFKR